MGHFEATLGQEGVYVAHQIPRDHPQPDRGGAQAVPVARVADIHDDDSAAAAGYPDHLVKSRAAVGEAGERGGAHHRVEVGVGEGDRLHRRPAQVGAQPGAAQVLGGEGDHPGVQVDPVRLHPARVAGQQPTRTEAHFQHPRPPQVGQSAADPAPPQRHRPDQRVVHRRGATVEPVEAGAESRWVDRLS